MDFLKNFKTYVRLPEMKILWLFLFLALLILAVDAVNLNSFLTVMSGLILLSVGAMIFAMNIQAAKNKVQLMDETRRLDDVISSMNDGVIVYDQDFVIRLFNKAAEGIFGMASREIVGQTISPESARNPQLDVLTKIIFQSLAPQVIRRTAEGEYPQVADISFEEPRRELRVTTDRMTDDRGNITGFLKIVRDRTREIELVKSKSEFITVAAHQLRTPLSAINWALQSLHAEQLNDDQKELAKTGLAATMNLQKIVEDLLNVAKIEEGKFGYNFQKTDIVAFLQNVLNQASPVAKEYNVKIYMENPPEPAMAADVDVERMSLVVANLLENAIKYNVPSGQVVVSIARQTDAPYLQVNIADTGMGMDTETVGKLFTKFFRGENVIAKETEGSGLGLYIVRNIIRRHGGKIWVESELNRGTTFHFTIPTDASLVPQKEIAESD